MTRSVLYDEPGPRTLRQERVASAVVGGLVLVVAVVAVRAMMERGLFE